MHKKHYTTVSIQVRSTVNTNQIKSLILIQNTRSVQEMESLPMRKTEKCIIFVIFVRFCFNNNKNTALRKA